MIYRLIILSGDRRGEQITLSQDPMTIGRDKSCDICLNDPEIALSHAEITHTTEGLFIRDLGSMNRLIINHREVHEAHPKHGDVVEVGNTRLLIQAYVQAEVQGKPEKEEKDEEDKRWRIVGAFLLLLVTGIIIFIPRCERWMISPRTRQGKLPAAQLLPPPGQMEISRPT
ncbi:MAG: FHA domain-containing protein, partial [bacterium]